MTTQTAPMADVPAVLAKFTPEGDFVPALVIDEALAWLEEHDPEGLAAWLWEHRRAVLGERFTRHLNAQRAVTLRRARAREFGEASSAFDEGDAEPISHFAVRYMVDEGGTRRRVADMTGADHRFVAGLYEADAGYKRLLAAFHREVAKKVRGKRTADVMDEATYERVYLSIVGGEAA